MDSRKQCIHPKNLSHSIQQTTTQAWMRNYIRYYHTCIKQVVEKNRSRQNQRRVGWGYTESGNYSTHEKEKLLTDYNDTSDNTNAVNHENNRIWFRRYAHVIVAKFRLPYGDFGKGKTEKDNGIQ